jgi:hypothetical protein
MSEELLKKTHECIDTYHVCECKYKDFHFYIRTTNVDLVHQFFEVANVITEMLTKKDD